MSLGARSRHLVDLCGRQRSEHTPLGGTGSGLRAGPRHNLVSTCTRRWPWPDSAAERKPGKCPVGVPSDEAPETGPGSRCPQAPERDRSSEAGTPSTAWDLEMRGPGPPARGAAVGTARPGRRRGEDVLGPRQGQRTGPAWPSAVGWEDTEGRDPEPWGLQGLLALAAVTTGSTGGSRGGTCVCSQSSSGDLQGPLADAGRALARTASCPAPPL